ncbi:thiol-disulfide isomerase/thioredoxin [Chryseobacterium sp. CBTAP 102]|uniref:TlpA disulfide reductase family protein n=1 Tax=unclassified Chryseobacterium TaxID=2593645 RepID=UPI000954D29E|nr:MULTISPECIES: TlpA disulfide reductase family protein [unclassified Chryseobacterium]PXW13719.1 thiol-disulfide isomerase/thioredoxin [Chryseobacterium sp. CBTAP 102]SIQ57040.1 Thiol-disulfide isomerase or thioredoxin [Chryseobacterium sp. RU33C]
MKYHILLILLLNNFYSSQTNKNTFTISGKINGQDNQYIYLSYLRLGKEKRERKWDSTKIKDGKFRFTGKITESKHGFITVLKKERTRNLNNKSITQRLFIDPGSEIKITINSTNFQTAKITGGISQEEYDSFNKEYANSKEFYRDLIKLQNIADSLNAAYYKINGKTDELLEVRLDSINSELEKKDQYFTILKKHLSRHPNSYPLLYLLSENYSEFEYSELSSYYKTLSTSSKKNEYGIQLKNYIEKLKLNFPGKEAIDFQATGYNNENVSLMNYKGKYILLDFWASWCIPCRKGNPKLIEIYNKYKDKGFIIIGIADDEGKKAAWKKAIIKDKIGIWPQIIDDKNIGEKYLIQSLPTKILINKDLKITHRFDYDDNLESIIDELLNK